MKCLIVVLFFAVALISAEPPAYRAAKFGSPKSQKQQVAPGNDIETLLPDSDVEGRNAAAPYPPSGWKPSGARLELPRAEVATTPAAEYLPAAEYGPPSGDNIESTTPDFEDDATTTEVDIETTTSADDDDDDDDNEGSADKSDVSEDKAKLIEDLDTVEVEAVPEQKVNNQGSYFVILPDARIQRVLYSVQQDPERLQFSTRLQSVGNQALTGRLFFFPPQYVQLGK